MTFRQAWAAIGISLLASVGCSSASQSSQAPAADSPEHYSQKRPSRDGIGKVYMGREISFTLGHEGVAWLERSDRETSERPDLLVQNLHLAQDAILADIGAGSGYFTFRISALVPEGKVLAVDVQAEMLQEIEGRRQALGVTNIETVLGSLQDPNLPDGGVDAVLIVDAYHEFTHPREMMEAIFRDLKPGGLVFLVEYRGEDRESPIFPLHKMTVSQARKELQAVGLVLVENRDVLPQQHLMVFQKSTGN